MEASLFVGTKIFLTRMAARRMASNAATAALYCPGFPPVGGRGRESASSKRCATNLVRFIVQECNEAIIAAYLYKGLDTDVRGEGEGSELSQFSCSAGDDAVGGKEGWAGNCWEHCRSNVGRCKLRPCGGSTSVGENQHLAFTHFKTKTRRS